MLLTQPGRSSIQPLHRLRRRLDEPADQPMTFIATPTPEMYVNSVFDDDFRAILKSTTSNMVDGMGLHAMLKLFGYRSSRLTGTGLVEELLAQNVGTMSMPLSGAQSRFDQELPGCIYIENVPFFFGAPPEFDR